MFALTIASQQITFGQRIVPLVMVAAVAVVTVELIRRRKLREEYAMLWILASIALLVFAVFPRLLFLISELIGVYYITTLVIIMFAFLSLVMIHLGVSASRSADDARKLAQRLALLEQKLNSLDSAANKHASASPSMPPASGDQDSDTDKAQPQDEQ